MGTTAADLDARFGAVSGVAFRDGPQGTAAIDIATDRAHASIALHGGQVLAWQPRKGGPGTKAGDGEGGDDSAAPTAAPVLWLSPGARFEEGKAVRGGIPVCWPWFGAHPSLHEAPSHGLVRTVPWQVEVCTLSAERGVDLRLTAPRPAPADRNTAGRAQPLWPPDAKVGLEISVGRQLRLALTTHNEGPEAITLSQALHTYFHVGDIAATRITGLEGAAFIDTLRDDAVMREAAPITIDREVDRIYVDAPQAVTIHDEANARRIIVEKRGSASWVVWNPWTAKAARLGDMGDDAAQTYRQMVCVETTNAASDARLIEPGATHTMETTIAVVTA
ncbi:MAG: D-hexose-6-phosphate mutarotase [Pseudomonadota bacterium]